MLIEFEYTPEDFQKGIHLMMRGGLVELSLKVGLILLPSLALFTVSVGEDKVDMFWIFIDWMAPFFVIYIGLFAFRFGQPHMVAFKSMRVPILQGPRKLEISENGIRSESKTGENTTHWAAYRKFK